MSAGMGSRREGPDWEWLFDLAVIALFIALAMAMRGFGG